MPLRKTMWFLVSEPNEKVCPGSSKLRRLMLPTTSFTPGRAATRASVPGGSTESKAPTGPTATSARPIPPRTVSLRARRVTLAVTRTANRTATPNVTPRAVSAYLALRTSRLRYEIVDSDRMVSDPHRGAAFNARVDAGRGGPGSGGSGIQLLEPAQHRAGPSLMGAVG